MSGSFSGCARAASGQAAVAAAPPSVVTNSRRLMEPLLFKLGRMRGRRPPRSEPRCFFEIDLAPTDGIKLPVKYSGDVGASPLLGKLSGKQERSTARERYTVSVSMAMSVTNLLHRTAEPYIGVINAGFAMCHKLGHYKLFDHLVGGCAAVFQSDGGVARPSCWRWGLCSLQIALSALQTAFDDLRAVLTAEAKALNFRDYGARGSIDSPNRLLDRSWDVPACDRIQVGIGERAAIVEHGVTKVQVRRGKRASMRPMA